MSLSERLLTSTIDPDTGALNGSAERYAKRIADLEGIYADEAAFAAVRERLGAEAAAYTVHTQSGSREAGDLVFGTTVMRPGKVGREYFMTRGHLHAVAERTEIYAGVRGVGVMLMESLDGDVVAEEMRPNTVVYIPPRILHRSVNVGEQPFVTLFCFPADAGQNYGPIERSRGMGRLVVDDGAGGWALEDNPRYITRRGAQAER